jgi:predicted secreted protein
MSHLLDALDMAEKEDEAKKHYKETHKKEFETLDDVVKFTNNKPKDGEGIALASPNADKKE